MVFWLLLAVTGTICGGLLAIYVIWGQPGRSGFSKTQRALLAEVEPLTRQVRELLGPWVDDSVPAATTIAWLGAIPALKGNSVRLLPRGAQAFEPIFEAIDSARQHVLVQFYIFRDDSLGQEMQQRLIAAAHRGARVYLLFDRVESRLSDDSLRPLTQAGVEVAGYRPERGWARIHWKGFRNHRKMVVIDGMVAIMGGINVAEEYVDRVAQRAPWIDTQLEVRGPAALALQLIFVRDFHCATRQTVDLSWQTAVAQGKTCTLAMVATDPHPQLDACTLMFGAAMALAQQRIWMATPYFVPDEKGLAAIELAILRGVEVRVLLPESSDVYPTEFVAWHFIARLLPLGVRFFLQKGGSMHQKVILLDNSTALVGSANFDHRSFRLNLELTAWLHGEEQASMVEQSLLEDFARCREVEAVDVQRRSLREKALTQLTRILTPVL
jgi:cardiolipin synthase